MNPNPVRVLVLACVFCSFAQAGEPAPLPAFPGAEGFGAGATGGRGGEIYLVTNLEDAGPGSLREAVSRGPRIVLFTVGGDIQLKSQLHVASDITIAGQSAPGQGVGTIGSSVSFSDSSNVIVRYIRFRQGLVEGQEKKCAVNMNKARNIILDHVSIQWGRWDAIGVTQCENITFQDCIIAEGIAPQRFGGLCESQNLSLLRNLWINHKSRNPKAKGRTQYINNVVYNWETDAYIAGASAGLNYHDVIGNYFIKGPSTKDASGAFSRGNVNTNIFVKDNWIDENRNGALDGRLIPSQEVGAVTFAPDLILPANYTLLPAAAAFSQVVDSVGCSLSRDAVDTRLLAQLRSLGTAGKVILDPQETGGYIPIEPTAPLTDLPDDGIPDQWKYDNNLDTQDPAAAQKKNAKGYTMVEVYVNSLAGRVE